MTTPHQKAEYLLGDFEKARSAALAYYDELIVACAVRNQRIAELESALRDRDLELAETWSLVLSHEGHIETQTKCIAELGTQRDALLEACEWIVNVASDVSKNGGLPSDDEYIAALEAGMAAIAKAEADAERAQTGGEKEMM
jgi:hypothetical protein